MKKHLILGLIGMSMMSSSAFAVKEGGGGDARALAFKAAAGAALKNLQLMQNVPFTNVDIAKLQTAINTAHILVSDSSLPVSKDGVTQDGTAENQPSLNLIILNGSKISKIIGNDALLQAVALHEFLSLEGVESTGNYPISGAYLIAKGGGTSENANQQIDSASRSILTPKVVDVTPVTRAYYLSFTSQKESDAIASISDAKNAWKNRFTSSSVLKASDYDVWTEIGGHWGNSFMAAQLINPYYTMEQITVELDNANCDQLNYLLSDKNVQQAMGWVDVIVPVFPTSLTNGSTYSFMCATYSPEGNSKTQVYVVVPR